MKAGLSHCINKAVQERVCSLLHLPGCSYSSRTGAPFPSDGSLKVISQRDLCPEVKCSGILSPSVPACLLLCQAMSCWSSLVPPWGTRASPAWPWPTGTDTAEETSAIGTSSFPLFIRLLHHSQKGWRLQIPQSAAGTSHFQTLPPLKKQEWQAQDKIFSHSCGCQDLKHLSCSLHIFIVIFFHVPVFCLLSGSGRGTYFCFSPIHYYQSNGKIIPDPSPSTDFHVTLTRSLYLSCSLRDLLL